MGVSGMEPTHTDAKSPLPGLEDRIAAFASLADPTRRRLYLYAISRPDGAGRDEAAEAVGITRALAAFHLDRLTSDGLLVAGYRRLTGRSGPGAGRPAKIYRRSPKDLSFSVPQRNYELLARVLVEALTSGEEPSDALGESAQALGRNIGARARAEAGPRPSRRRLLASGCAALDECGFGPAMDTYGCIELGNCPFRPLSNQYTDLVCHANQALMTGFIEELGLEGYAAVLRSHPDETCCVSIERRSGGASVKNATARRPNRATATDDAASA